MRPPARLEGRLAALADAPVNYNAAALDLDHPSKGWGVDDRRTPLPAEAPGEPVDGGPFQIASRLIRGYEFADPSLVRGYYDPDAPLQGRNMLLGLRAAGLVTIHVGVRVCVVWDETRTMADTRQARVFGWAYRTLEGHVERGQMDWAVWKWLDTGEVEFRTHAVSRTAHIANPIIWAGFHVLKGHERRVYLDSTEVRMRTLTARALGEDSASDAVREASSQLTARGGADAEDPAHDELAARLKDGSDS